MLRCGVCSWCLRCAPQLPTHHHRVYPNQPTPHHLSLLRRQFTCFTTVFSLLMVEVKCQLRHFANVIITGFQMMSYGGCLCITHKFHKEVFFNVCLCLLTLPLLLKHEWGEFLGGFDTWCTQLLYKLHVTVNILEWIKFESRYTCRHPQSGAHRIS